MIYSTSKKLSDCGTGMVTKVCRLDFNLTKTLFFQESQGGNDNQLGGHGDCGGRLLQRFPKVQPLIKGKASRAPHVFLKGLSVIRYGLR